MNNNASNNNNSSHIYQAKLFFKEFDIRTKNYLIESDFLMKLMPHSLWIDPLWLEFDTRKRYVFSTFSTQGKIRYV